MAPIVVRGVALSTRQFDALEAAALYGNRALEDEPSCVIRELWTMGLVSDPALGSVRLTRVGDRVAHDTIF